MKFLITFSLFFPLSVFAFTYARTPNGGNISNSVTFDVTLAESDIVPGDDVYWTIQTRYGNTQSMTTVQIGNILSTDNLTQSVTLNLPTGQNYLDVWVCKSTILEYYPPDTSILNCADSFYLEGNGDPTNVQFAIAAPPAPSTAAVTGGGGPIQFNPEIKLYAPQKGEIFSSQAEIRYEAEDQNDFSSSEKERFGLGDTPISLYYSDLIETWDRKRVRDDFKTLIVKDLPQGGSYNWNVKDIPDGDNYRIVVNAVDNFGDIGENLSEIFSIDHTAPTFKSNVDPPVSRGEDVKIIIEASEDLVETPRVQVNQRGLPAATLDVKGEKKIYEAIYRVVTGYDGPAVITVSGRDLAGNTGNTIVSGGRFSVGIEPPPKPKIFEPLDKDIVASEIVSLKGNAREDTEVIILVNGVAEYKTKPDKEGNFIFENIKISRILNKGLNTLSVTSRDQAGNTSEPATITLKFNIEPALEILWPKKDSLASTTSIIGIRARDENQDKLSFTYEVSRDDGKNWTILAESTPAKEYSWDTVKFPEGNYILRVTANDGFSKVQASSGKFSVRNYLPIVSFEKGEKVITNKSTAEIKGSILIQEGLPERPTTTNLEYSLDDGKTWANIPAGDGNFNSFSEEFLLSLKNLEEKLYSIPFRSKDNRGLYGYATFNLVVDFGPPFPPIITAPASLTIYSDVDDQDKEIAGVQIAISGESEPESKITIAVDDKVFDGKAGDDGLFRISGVTLRKHGQNDLKIFAADAAGNKSKDAAWNLIYNNPPNIKFISPRENRGINHKAIIKWETRDPDLDAVLGVNLSYKREKDQNEFKPLIKDTAKNSFEWEASDFKEDNYELKLEATDGISAAAKIINIFIDNTPPIIEMEELSEKTFKKAFSLKIKGKAKDNFSGIEFAEYSFDGEHWFKALITKGYLKRETEFIIKHPYELKDGAYNIQFRIVDAAGNRSEPKFQEIIIDTIPPRIGSYILSKGILALLPENGAFKTLLNSKLNFVISLEEDAKEAFLTVNEQKLALKKNKAAGLWGAEILFSRTGESAIAVSAKDWLDNFRKEEQVGSVKIVDKGKVRSKDGEPLGNAKLTALIFNKDAQSFIRWPSEIYDLKNPIATDEQGEYELFLPSGKYQIVVNRSGFDRVRSSEFEIIEPRFINADFIMQKRKGILGQIRNFWEKLNLPLKY